MRNSTFLLQFQEKHPIEKVHMNDQLLDIAQTATQTMTYTREEPDQDESSLSMGTRTITETREESDQDPSVLALGTRTETRAREEPDQDVSNSSYAVLPK